MLINAGAFHAEICRLSRRHQQPLFGSSANLSLSGTKFRVSDIEPEILAMADVVIDYENVERFQTYAADGFEVEYLVFVSSQYGPRKVSVYGFGKKKEQ